MHISESAPRARRTPLYFLRLLVLAFIATSVYTLLQLQQTSTELDSTAQMITAQSSPAASVRLGDTALTIPDYSMFRQGNLWALISKAHTLQNDTGYALVAIPVAHGDAELPMKVSATAAGPLSALVAAAKADDEPLMVSSAYRTFAEQQKAHDDYVAQCGEACAKQYVLPVGASEHHTGLAIDFSSESDACAADSNDCSLSGIDAAWLAKHAADYGFIHRYPAGKQAITGVANEAWHYRYVGVPMAKAVTASGLTYDEVVQQLAPGYASTH